MNYVVAGSGYLGEPIARRLVHTAEAKVLLLSHAPSDEIHRRIRSVACELSDGIGDRLAKFCDEKGAIDGFVYAAGKSTRGTDLDGDMFRDGMERQAELCQRLIGDAVPYIAENGSIVVVASMWGMLAPDFKLYLDLNNEPSPAAAASSGAIISLVKYLAALIADRSIRVNAVVPGWFPKPGPVERKDYIDGLCDRIPLGRIGKPSDLIGPVEFLLSDAASYITGQTLVVDGGYSIR